MQREIKFRVWDKEEKNMTTLDQIWIDYEYSSLAFQNKELDGICEWPVSGNFDLKNHVIMQYTGLKDKNSKEIYEGDILTIYEHNFSPNNFIAEWSNICYGWFFYSTKKCYEGISEYCFSYSSINGFESDAVIIGNIYENSELLEDRK